MGPKKLDKNISSAEHYLQMILDNSRVIIVTTDNEGRIVEFNREAEKLLEYAKDSVVGKDILILYDKAPERSEIRKTSALDDKIWIWGVRDREVQLKSKTGRVYHVILTLSTMTDGEGKIIGTVGVGRDITEHKMLQFKLTQSEKLAGIGTLASGIAHEINNPLAGILGMAEAIRDEDDPGLVKSYAKDIIEYAVHAKNIVTELSAYSRSAAFETHSVVDLCSIIENSLKMARHGASFKGIKTVKEFGQGCLVNANGVEMQQVFINLIVNAAHAMKDKGALTLKCAKGAGFVSAAITDTGCGIPKADVSHIFDPFYTTKPAGSGTGLGLYVVYKIVTKHRGIIDVQSAVGEGTTFTVKLPAGVDSEGQPAME
ncbi:MAG: PAS domain S-box protein [Deltaproteobacteria bacterium]|nr:PAS domain S-box protein [Deltaproteobacteria bacterium]